MNRKNHKYPLEYVVGTDLLISHLLNVIDDMQQSIFLLEEMVFENEGEDERNALRKEIEKTINQDVIYSTSEQAQRLEKMFKDNDQTDSETLELIGDLDKKIKVECANYDEIIQELDEPLSNKEIDYDEYLELMGISEQNFDDLVTNAYDLMERIKRPN